MRIFFLCTSWVFWTPSVLKEAAVVFQTWSSYINIRVKPVKFKPQAQNTVQSSTKTSKCLNFSQKLVCLFTKLGTKYVNFDLWRWTSIFQQKYHHMQGGLGIMIWHPGMVRRSGQQARKKRNPSKRTSRELPESQKMLGGPLVDEQDGCFSCTTYLLVVNCLEVALATVHFKHLGQDMFTPNLLSTQESYALWANGKVLQCIWKGWALLEHWYLHHLTWSMQWRSGIYYNMSNMCIYIPLNKDILPC